MQYLEIYGFVIWLLGLFFVFTLTFLIVDFIVLRIGEKRKELGEPVYEITEELEDE